MAEQKKDKYWVSDWSAQTFERMRAVDFPFDDFVLTPATREPVLDYLPPIADRNYDIDGRGKIINGKGQKALQAKEDNAVVRLAHATLQNFAGSEFGSALFNGDAKIATVLQGVTAKNLPGVGATLGQLASDTIGCHFEGLGGNALQGFGASNVYIEKCTTKDNNKAGHPLGNHAADLVKIWGSSTGSRNVVIKNCQGEKVNSNFIWLDSDVRGGKIQNIYGEDLARSVLMMELCSDFLIHKVTAVRPNQLDDPINHYTGGGIVLMNTEHSRVVSSRVEQPGAGGIVLWSWDWSREDANLEYPGMLTKGNVVKRCAVDFGNGEHFKQSKGAQLTGAINFDDSGKPWDHPTIADDNVHEKCTVRGVESNIAPGNKGIELLPLGL